MMSEHVLFLNWYEVSARAYVPLGTYILQTCIPTSRFKRIGNELLNLLHRNNTKEVVVVMVGVFFFHVPPA